MSKKISSGDLPQLLEWHAARCRALAEACVSPRAKRILRLLAADLAMEAQFLGRELQQRQLAPRSVLAEQPQLAARNLAGGPPNHYKAAGGAATNAISDRELISSALDYFTAMHEDIPDARSPSPSKWARWFWPSAKRRPEATDMDLRVAPQAGFV